jgi:hypothetical protein
VLQIIASQFFGQTLQERAGKSEMGDGIRNAMLAKELENSDPTSVNVLSAGH